MAASLPHRPDDQAGAAALCADFSALPADVKALFDAAGAHDFQASAAWFTHFVQTVDLAGAMPQLPVWREAGRAVAALPVLLTRSATGFSVTGLGNYYTTRFAPLLAPDATAAQAQAWLGHLLADLLRRFAPLHTLRFDALEDGSLAALALRSALRQQGCAVFGHTAFRNWVLPVTHSWPPYLAARDGKLRTTLTRMGKRFPARGGRLELLQGGPGLERAIAAYTAVYAASWKQPEPHPQFMPGLIRAAAAAGVLRMGIAWLDGQAVAAQVWMTAGGRADIYKLAHDERHKEMSPGSLLTALLMQHAFEVDQVRVVDYLSGDDPYKRLWMSDARQRTGLLAHNPRTPRGLLGLLRESLARAWRRSRASTARD